MRRLLICLASVGSVLASLAGSADAFTCYVLYDRSENVVYRDTHPPVDMSNEGAPARERLRQRGEYLLAMEAERCPQVEFVFGSAGSSTLTVDEIVAGIPTARTSSTASPGAPSSAAARAAGARSTPAPSSRSGRSSATYK